MMITARKIARSRFFVADSTGVGNPTTDEYPRPSHGWNVYAAADMFDLEVAEPVGKTGYLVQVEWHRACPDDPGYAWVLQEAVPRTNLSGQERPVGWLGTTDGISRTSYGRYAAVRQTSDGRVLLKPVTD